MTSKGGFTIRRSVGLIAIALASLIVPEANAADSEDFETWFQQKIDERIAELQKQGQAMAEEFNKNARVAAGATAPMNQEQTAASTTNTSTLVDTSSASDFVSVALNLAGLSGSTVDGADAPTAASATVSGYAFYAAANGTSPLDSNAYCKRNAQFLRRLSATLGYESSDDGSSGPILIGAKFTLPFIDRRNICNDEQFKDLDDPLKDVAVEYGEAFERAVTAIHGAIKALALVNSLASDDSEALAKTRAAATLSDTEFNQCLTSNSFIDRSTRPPSTKVCEGADADNSSAFFDWVVSVLGEEELERVAVAPELTGRLAQAERALQKKIAGAVREFETQPRFAAQFNTKQNSASDDEYVVTGVVDFGLRPGLTAILNAGWERRPDASGTTTDSAIAALALEYELPREFLTAQRPIRISLAADGNWVKSAADTYKGQVKTVIPVPGLTGVELPLSLTVANRTELIEETDIRGLVGFTIDTSRLFAAFSGSSSPFDMLSP